MKNLFFSDYLGIGCIVGVFVMSLLLTCMLLPLINRKKKSNLLGIAASIFISAGFVCAGFSNNDPLLYSIMFCTTLLATMFIMRIPKIVALFTAIFVTFHILSIKAIVIGTYSLIIVKNMYRIQNDPALWKHVNIICSAIICILFVIYFIAFKKTEARAKLVFQRPKQLGTAGMIHAFLALFLLYFSYNYSFSLNLVWFSVAQILTGVCIMWIYWVVFAYSVRMANALDKLKDKQQHANINTQLAYYQQYEENFKYMQQFKHNYEELVLSLKYLLDEGELEEAAALLEEDKASFDVSYPNIKQYSNNKIINALLLTYDNIAKQGGFKFTARVFVPESCPISDEDLHHVMTNVLDNAAKECSKAEEGKAAYIYVDSRFDNNWLSIKAENKCFGQVRMLNKKVVTAPKNDDEYVERGIDIINVIMENYNGISNYQYIATEKKFVVTLAVRCEN